MLWGLFGWQIALLYIATGVMLAKEMGVNATFEKVQDIQKIMSYGIMSTPALVIDEKVKVYGKVPNKDVIKKYIEEEM